MLVFNVLRMIPTPQTIIQGEGIIITFLGTKKHIKEVQPPIQIIHPIHNFQGLTRAQTKLKIRTLL